MGVWEKIQSEVSPGYAWQEFGMDGTNPIGLWVKRLHP
jgi:hypothetical protein